MNKQMGSTLVVGVLLAMMSGCPAQEVAPLPDAYRASVDAYTTPLPDTGPPPPPTCTGSAPTCLEQTSTTCCLPEGTTPIGGACMFANSCVRGGICLGSVCRQLCDDPADCTSGACVSGSSGIFTCG